MILRRRKRLDVYFLKDVLYRRAHEELKNSMITSLDTEDYITPKLQKKITKNYEKLYADTISAIDREARIVFKRRRKLERVGLLKHSDDINYLLKQEGIYFIEEMTEQATEEQAEAPEQAAEEQAAEGPKDTTEAPEQETEEQATEEQKDE